jgi:hypothetical protein
LFGQADPLSLGPLPADDVLSDLAARFAAEGLDPGPALPELAGFARGHPQRVMLLSYLLAEQLTDGGRPGTLETAALVLDDALMRTRAAHQALWSQLSRSEKVVLAGVADGLAPGSRSLAREHRLSRQALHDAGERLADQGHLTREARSVRLADPLLAEWLRRR